MFLLRYSRQRLELATAALLVVSTGWASDVTPPVRDELVIPEPGPTEPRPVRPSDLIGVRDIGGGASNGAITVSPNSEYVAFQLQQGDAVEDRYRTAWFVTNTTPGSAIIALGKGGDVILSGEGSGRIGGERVGMEARWSPDSEWIAYRLKRNGEIQLWRSHREGGVQEQLTHNASNVTDFMWSAGGNQIFFQVGRSRDAMRLTLEKEGDRGYLFDDRFIVSESVEPIFANPEQTDPFDPESAVGLWVYDLEVEDERPASAADKRAYDMLTAEIRPQGIDKERSIHRAIRFGSAVGTIAWLENDNPKLYAGFRPPLVVYAITAEGAEVRCSAPACTGHIQQPMWSSDGHEIYFVRHEGVNRVGRGIYAWRPATDTLRTILKTNDRIEDCELANERLICLHESPTTPGRIVAIDPVTGSVETLVDPNPEFQNFIFTKVEKLEWQEVSGAYAIGNLVYPLGYETGKRFPLIIVQYRSRGFLRGGVGDEYPIHPLAANGFFVLSVDRPEKPGVAETIADMYQAERALWGEDFWERESALSALEIMIDKLVERGLVDRERVGITGLSDGSETVWYAMIHSKYFAAAMASSGGWSPNWYYLVSASMREKYLRGSAGLLPPGKGGDDRWRRISPEFHADSIDTPILVQVADRELVMSAPSISALMDARKPIEAHVFPGEYHVKWRPKHKLAVYERAVDWFNFWLGSLENTDPSKAAQYERWQRLRELRDEFGS